MAKYTASTGVTLVEIQVVGDADVTKEMIEALSPFFWDGQHTTKAEDCLYFYCSAAYASIVMEIVQSFNEGAHDWP